MAVAGSPAQNPAYRSSARLAKTSRKLPARVERLLGARRSCPVCARDRRKGRRRDGIECQPDDRIGGPRCNRGGRWSVLDLTCAREFQQISGLCRSDALTGSADFEGGCVDGWPPNPANCTEGTSLRTGPSEPPAKARCPRRTNPGQYHRFTACPVANTQGQHEGVGPKHAILAYPVRIQTCAGLRSAKTASTGRKYLHCRQPTTGCPLGNVPAARVSVWSRHGARRRRLELGFGHCLGHCPPALKTSRRRPGSGCPRKVPASGYGACSGASELPQSGHRIWNFASHFAGIRVLLMKRACTRFHVMAGVNRAVTALQDSVPHQIVGCERQGQLSRVAMAPEYRLHRHTGLAQLLPILNAGIRLQNRVAACMVNL